MYLLGAILAFSYVINNIYEETTDVVGGLRQTAGTAKWGLSVGAAETILL